MVKAFPGPALLGPDSPLAHLPSDLHPRQRLFFDAIRYSIAMLDVSFVRLLKLLIHVSHLQVLDGEEGTDQDLVFPRAFADAFSVVDMANRLTSLVSKMPGFKRTPEVELFIRKVGKAEEVRHAVQHLNREVERLAVEDEATWGWLLWVFAPEPKTGVFHSFFALPGSMGKTKISPETRGPEGIFRSPVDQVELSAYGHRLSLTDLWDATADFVPILESTLREMFEGRPVSVTDMLIRVEGHVTNPPT